VRTRLYGVTPSRPDPVGRLTSETAGRRTGYTGGIVRPARRARAFRRLSDCRCSADCPPHTPASWRVSIAQLRQVSMTSQRWQTALASSICRNAGSVLPIGKKSSGSSSRHAARSRQVIRIGLLVRLGAADRENESTDHRAGPRVEGKGLPLRLKRFWPFRANLAKSVYPRPRLQIGGRPETRRSDASRHHAAKATEPLCFHRHHRCPSPQSSAQPIEASYGEAQGERR